jgi:hypothetical protein
VNRDFIQRRSLALIVGRAGLEGPNPAIQRLLLEKRAPLLTITTDSEFADFMLFPTQVALIIENLKPHPPGIIAIQNIAGALSPSRASVTSQLNQINGPPGTIGRPWIIKEVSAAFAEALLPFLHC